jgi:hypothetical protein
MGMSESMRCRDCGTDFMWDEGGGFTFHVLHCDRCGTAKAVGFDDTPEATGAYLKGLPGPYSVATADYDRLRADRHHGEPIDDATYYRLVEEHAGNCDCGGKFRLRTPPRCPACRSTSLGPGSGGIVMYD